MAEKKTGVLQKVFEKGFGFILVDGENRELFVHKSQLKGRPMIEGTLLRFEESGPIAAKGGKTEAINVEVVGPVAPPAPTPADPKPIMIPSKPVGLTVKWRPIVARSVRSPANLPVDQQAEFLELEVPVTLKKGNEVDMGGYSVGLEYLENDEWTNATEPVVNPMTDDSGNAYFRFLIAPDSESCDLRLQVTAPGGSAMSNFVQRWHKTVKETTTVPVAQPVTSNPATTTVEVDDGKGWTIEVVNPPRDPDPTTGLFLVNVVTRKDDKKTNLNFAAYCDQAIQILQQTPTGLNPVTTFTPQVIGQYQLHVGFAGIMVKIVFQLDNGQQAVIHLRK